MIKLTDEQSTEYGFYAWKDANALNDLVSICYVPEEGLDDRIGYTFGDFLRMTHGDLQKAIKLFHACEWQHPETILDEDEEGCFS